MKNKWKTIGKLLFVVLLPIVMLLSCSKWDDYKKYTAKGENIYSGKLDSVKAYGGNKRVRITAQPNADPKIATVRIFWSDQDSIVFDAKTSLVNGFFDQIFPVPEGIANFTIYTYDAAGNKSVPAYTSATIYGDRYLGTLSNRLITDAQLQPDGSAKIDWADINANAGVIGMQVQYMNSADANKDTTITSTSATAFSSILPDYKVGSTFQYRTLYKPNPTVIDTFFTDFQTINVKADVTGIYLSNYGPNFSGTLGSDGRFGTLNAPWISNAGALNKGGSTYGGYQYISRQSTGVITWETWNNTPVVDGKVYQVTSSQLPAGNYTVSFTYYSEVQQNSSVYCIVAAGGNGIPSLPDLSTSLGYAAMFNGANVGSTSPRVTETKSFDFTITTPQLVSLGFLGNIIGNGNPGSYFEVKSIKLTRN